MTIEEVVRMVLLDEHAAVIREAVKAVAAQLMEREVSEVIGAELGERRPENRATHRNCLCDVAAGARATASSSIPPSPVVAECFASLGLLKPHAEHVALALDRDI
jgi:hypothetical protein